MDEVAETQPSPIPSPKAPSVLSQPQSQHEGNVEDNIDAEFKESTKNDDIFTTLPPTLPANRSSKGSASNSIKQLISDRDSLKVSKSPANEPTPSGADRGSHKLSNTPVNEQNISEAVSKLVPQGKSISDHVDELTESVQQLAQNLGAPQPALGDNLEKITKMSQVLTNEANALRQSIRSLSDDIAYRTCKTDVNFPYHLFLIEMVVNKIHMKCECFNLDDNNLVISATFLGKSPIILYDSSYGKIENFSKLNVGKSTLFAMTYDKICCIDEFEIYLQLTKEPPCTSCVTKIADTRMDFTKEFCTLREELCKKWHEEKPKDNIICTTSTPLSKSMFYLSCGERCNPESIGVIEVSVRMSFLGKEINTAFCANPKPKGTSTLLKEENGMTMYACQKVEMDDQGKILLDENELLKKRSYPRSVTRRTESPMSQIYSKQFLDPHHVSHPDNRGGVPKFDEIFTKMNENELRIRVPKSTKMERIGKYDKINELCTCEETPYNTGEQIQFEMPREVCYPDKTHNTYSSNLKYTYKGCDKTCESKERKIVNVTPSNCPISAVNMEKAIHPQKDVFILKIGKKMETKDKKTDLEIELVTPKAPHDKTAENAAAQCSTTSVKSGSNKGRKKKGKGKGGKSGKGAKAGKGGKGSKTSAKGGKGKKK